MEENYKTNHYWQIHKKVLTKLYDELPSYVQRYISGDDQHQSKTFREFTQYVDSEALICFEDGDFYYNNPDTFKYNGVS